MSQEHEHQLSEQLQLTLLRTLRLNETSYAVPSTVLRMMAAAQGHPTLTVPEAEAELRYLEQAGLVEQPPKLLHPENKHWRITKAGRDFLAEHGIA